MPPGQMAKAGAFVSIDSDGRLRVERGYVRPEDEAVAEPDGEGADGADGCLPAGAEPGQPQRAVITIGGAVVEWRRRRGCGGPRSGPCRNRLVTETDRPSYAGPAGCRGEIPHVALTALLHRLLSDTFLRQSRMGCLEAQVREVHFPAQAEDLRDSASALSIAERNERWGDHVPAMTRRCGTGSDALDDASRLELLAHCVSFGVNAL